jgi:GAF domain-containing protein
MTDQAVMSPSEAFAHLGNVNLAENDLQQVLTRVSELAKRTIVGATEVSVTLIDAKAATTAAYTGSLALMLDEQQYDIGHGPCLAAGTGGSTVLIADMSAEDRWPAYTPRCLEQGVHSVVSVGLPIQRSVTGAINIYAVKPHAFDADAVSLAQTFAGYAAVALANAHLYTATAALAKQMQEAMASRAVIEQAKGILIAESGCSPEQAFDLLIRQSQAANRKLRDIAHDIVQRAQA